MWKYLVSCLILLMFSCSGINHSDKQRDGNEENGNDITTLCNIQGQWGIENIVENDSSYVRPSEIETGMQACVDFKDDNTFGIMTNCNHIGGEYRQRNDSLYLKDISATEIACDNMEVEEKLKKVLQIVNTIDCINDSITRLNTEKGDSYIVLKKKKPHVK